MAFKILFIGDVVGSPGRRIVAQALPRLIHQWGISLVVCNAENSAAGSGLTDRCFEELTEAGVDVLTMGDHVYRRDEIYPIFERTDRICRPANFPSEAPGADSCLVEARDGTLVGVFTILGRTFMKPVDCPLRAADVIINKLASRTKIILVDMHAEATGEKQTIGRWLDGRVSAVLGTHTHVPTADEQILPGGTAYQTDVGMTGPHDSIIGRRVEDVVRATYSCVPRRFEVAVGDPRLRGALVEIDTDSGLALSIRRVDVDQTEAQRLMTASFSHP